MTKRVIGSAVGAALLLGMVAVAGDKAEEEAARKDVLDVARAIEEGKGEKVIQAKVKAIKAKGSDLDVLMFVYKTKQKGGLGFGPNPAAKSGIEVKLVELQRKDKGPAPEVLKRDEKDLIKMAYVTLAMAEIARAYYSRGNRQTKKEWDKALDDKQQASKDLIEAAKKQDGRAVANAAKALLNSCAGCHYSYRK